MRAKNTLINTFLGAFYLVILTILAFVSKSIFISYLGIEYAGINAFFANVISVLSITELGISGAATYLLYKPIHEKNIDEIASIMNLFKKFYMLIGSIIFGLAIFFSFFVMTFIKETTLSADYIKFIFILYALGAAITYLFSYYRTFFYSAQKNYIVLTIDFFAKVARYLLQILSLILWSNFVAFILIGIVFNFLPNIIIKLYGDKNFDEILKKRKHQEVDAKIKEKFIKKIKELAVFQVTNIGVTSTDNIIISTFISVVQVGLYSNYAMITTQLFSFIVIAFSGVGASIGNLIAEKGEANIEKHFYKISTVFFWISSISVSGLLFLTHPFIQVWLGKEYLLSFNILVVLVINFYLITQRQVLNSFYSAIGEFKKFLLPAMVELILNLIISIVLAIKIGLIGVFIGTLIASIVAWMIQIVIFTKLFKVNIKKYLMKQAKFIVIIIAQVLLIRFGYSYISTIEGIVGIIMILGLVMFVVNIVNFLIFRKSDDFEYIKKSFIKIKELIFKKGVNHEN